jgi:hypothetical protein
MLVRRASLTRLMGEDALEALRCIVVDDPSLRARLLAAPNREAFVADVVEVGREHGVRLSAEIVLDGLHAARKQQRWV